MSEKATVYPGKYGDGIYKITITLEVSYDEEDLTKEEVLKKFGEEERTELGEMVLNNIHEAEVL